MFDAVAPDHWLEPPDESLFSKIADELLSQGFSINPAALPQGLSDDLLHHLHQMSEQKFDPAGIGRAADHGQNRFVRTDAICWIHGESEAGRAWLAWCSALQRYLNRRLMLGLFSFESHFAHYKPGDFYKRHLDAFRGEANRVLTLVTYLNANWMPDQGGEMVLYQNEFDQEGIRITPALGTLALFLSEEFPHEVLPATRDRYSIAGWFRVNGSTANRVDPPR